MRAHLLFSPLFVFALAGCGHDAGGTTTTTTTSLPAGASCAMLGETCAASQLGCVEDAAGARCVACGAGTYASPAGTCDAVPGTPLSHVFPDISAGAGEEVTSFCRSWTLNNETELWVNATELTQTEHSHHSNWVWVPDDHFTGPDEVWKCAERGYHFYGAIAAGGLVYAQSTQAAHEVQKFPAGAAVRIPPHARIVSDIHILNTGTEEITGHATLTLYSIEAAAVTTPLSAWHVEYDDLAIPPHATSRFTGQCSVKDAVSAATGQPFAPKVHYLLPHTHTLASGFFAEVLGGPSDGRALLDLGDFNGEAHGKMFDPPIDLAGADGVRFACQYTNPRDEPVGWGFGSAEMCELFGFAEGTPFFQARVANGDATGTEEGVQLFEGPCITEQVSGGG